MCLGLHPGGGLLLERATVTLNLSCSAPVSVRLIFFIADSVALMRSTIGKCYGVKGKFNSLARTSFFDWVSSLSDTHLS